MRVFVASVGRCGSVSFRVACAHASNYTTGHESLCGLLEYPDQHIEVSPHLRCCIVHLARKYPDAKWVHLRRSAATCVPSLARLDGGAVMAAYRLLHSSVMPSASIGDVAFRYYWSEVDVIDAQLRCEVAEDRRTVIELESAAEHWPDFWRWIGAEGDLAASLAEWSVRRNTGEERGES